ncbi:hypothetical protein B0H11DRAFT_2252620 [Mycena galericulata]|nr:hypothetical protein B0H11DRAFT_2252620 [Mycena galericulata]
MTCPEPLRCILSYSALPPLRHVPTPSATALSVRHTLRTHVAAPRLRARASPRIVNTRRPAAHRTSPHERCIRCGAICRNPGGVQTVKVVTCGAHTPHLSSNRHHVKYHLLLALPRFTPKARLIPRLRAAATSSPPSGPSPIARGSTRSTRTRRTPAPWRVHTPHHVAYSFAGTHPRKRSARLSSPSPIYRAPTPHTPPRIASARPAYLPLQAVSAYSPRLDKVPSHTTHTRTPPSRLHPASEVEAPPPSRPPPLASRGPNTRVEVYAPDWEPRETAYPPHILHARVAGEQHSWDFEVAAWSIDVRGTARFLIASYTPPRRSCSSATFIPTLAVVLRHPRLHPIRLLLLSLCIAALKRASGGEEVEEREDGKIVGREEREEDESGECWTRGCAPASNPGARRARAGQSAGLRTPSIHPSIRIVAFSESHHSAHRLPHPSPYTVPPLPLSSRTPPFPFPLRILPLSSPHPLDHRLPRMFSSPSGPSLTLPLPASPVSPHPPCALLPSPPAPPPLPASSRSRPSRALRPPPLTHAGPASSPSSGKTGVPRA